MQDRGARGAAQIKWEPNVTITKALRCRQWKHINRELFCVCVCACVFSHTVEDSVSPPPKKRPTATWNSLKNKNEGHSMSFWTSFPFFFTFFPLVIFKQAALWLLSLLQIHLKNSLLLWWLKKMWQLAGCCCAETSICCADQFFSCFLEIPRYLFVPAYCFLPLERKHFRMGLSLCLWAASEKEY